MLKLIKIAMLVTTKGSPDGITVKEYKAGGVYTVPADLAANFKGQGVAEDAPEDAPEGEPAPELTAHQVDGQNAGVVSWATMAIAPGLLALVQGAGLTPEAYLERKPELDAAEAIAHEAGMTLAEAVRFTTQDLEEFLEAVAAGQVLENDEGGLRFYTPDPENPEGGAGGTDNAPKLEELSAADAIARIKSLGNTPAELAELELWTADAPKARATVTAAATKRLAELKA